MSGEHPFGVEPPRPPSVAGGLLRLYRAMWHHAAGRRVALVGFLLLLLFAQIARLLIPYFFGEAVNALQRQGVQDLRAAAKDIGLMVAAAMIAWALHGPGRVIERFTALRIRERFADLLFQRTIAHPLRWHEAHHSGETIHRMSKATTALFNFSQQQFIYLQNLVNLVGPLIALCVVSLPTGLIALVGYVVVAGVLLRIDRVMIRLGREENRLERRHNAALVDCLGNVATVLALRLHEATRRLVGGRLAEVSVPLRRYIVINEVKWAMVDLLNTAVRSGLVIVYAILCYRATGSVLVGTAVMIYQYSQQVGNVVSAMAQYWAELVRFQTDLAAADELLDGTTEAPPGAAPVIPAAWQEIRVEDLQFRHPRARVGVPTLADIALTMRRGGRIALVGESGSGKSSLLRVLAGLHTADHARFVVDGAARTDLRDLGGAALLLPQDPEVFEATLEHNLTLGLPYSPEAIRRACELAAVAPFVDALPEGLATVVRERGLNLSGGQKQRLAMARGLLAASDASLVLLDEPTSSVDVAGEALIYDNLLAALGDRCVVSSIHRLHLLSRFDTVVLLSRGRIVDLGSLDELLARQPSFRAMWQSGFGPDEKTPDPQPAAA